MAEARHLEREARAKLNLRLRVLERGEDGFHGLETLFLRLELADRVEVVASGEPGIRLDLDGEGASADGLASVPSGPENLVWRAIERFHEAAGGEPAVTVRLHKGIPAGAGLGGGSADAAAALRAMNELTGSPLSGRELLRVAGEVGADVPFLAADLPAALAWGRGGRMLPVPSAPPRPMVLAVPDVRIGAGDAYGWLDEDREAPVEPGRAPDGGGAGDQLALVGFGEDGAGNPGGAGSGAEGAGGSRSGAGSGSGAEGTGAVRRPGPALLPPAGAWDDWATLERLAGNDFEAPVFARFPELGWWKEELEGEGAELALLCGSGSALAGVFVESERRDAAARRLEAAETVRVIRTRGPV